MDEFLKIVGTALDEESLLLLVLSKPAHKGVKISNPLKIRPILLKETLNYQLSSRTKTQEHHENSTKEELRNRIQLAFGTTYLHAHLYTTENDFEAKVDKNGKLDLKTSKPSHTKKPLEHNRSKNHLIPDRTTCPFLVATGVMNPYGLVKKQQYSKFRQINRFLELLNVVVPSLPQQGPLRIVDFGSGKSYLTFAVHHLFTRIHRREVEIFAVDRNEEIVESCRKIAQQLSIDEISFLASSISDLKIEGDIDLVISLHACDTATDDVLAKAIKLNAKAIFAVPCCHHELASTMQPPSMNGIMQHGILKEQTAALVTDALRAQVLEFHNYKTEVVEFIELEHTHKNVLIRAIKRVQPLSGEDLAAQKEEYEEQKRIWGIEKFHLESMLQ